MQASLPVASSRSTRRPTIPVVRPLERGVFVAVATGLTGGARPHKVAPQPRVDYAVREAQRAGRVEAVDQRPFRAVPHRLAAHLVQTTASRAVASRRIGAWIMAKRFAGRGSLPKRSQRRHNVLFGGCIALRRLTVSRPMRCVIPAAARQASVQRSRSGFSLCPCPSAFRSLPRAILTLEARRTAARFLRPVCAQCDLVMVIARPARSFPAR